MSRPRVLVFCSYYLPGYKAGGPIRSVASMVEEFGHLGEFSVVTSDRDLGDAAPYADTQPNEWATVGNARVRYLSHGKFSLSVLREIIAKIEPDVIYLAGGLDPRFSLRVLWYRRLGLIPSLPIVLASQGVFSQGALQSKWLKKAAFLQCAKAIGLFDKIDWHVSTSFEQSDVLRSACGRWCQPANMFVARDLSSVTICETSNNTKAMGRLRAVFVSRVSPKKNLRGALRILRSVKSAVEFDIYGPIEDRDYWAECQQEIETLPANVTVTYRGPIANSHVAQVMSEYDLFFLPTLGENFGHVILEALAVGCPVLISDQTAFRNLSRSKAGWDLPINDVAGFATAIERVSAMTPSEWQNWSLGAREFGSSVLRDPASTNEYRRMLRLQAA